MPAFVMAGMPFDFPPDPYRHVPVRYMSTSSASPTGQWSDPMTCMSIHASRTAPRSSSDTKK